MIEQRAEMVTGTDFRLVEVANVDSTNRAVADLWRAGEPFGFVLRADHQTAGRGRLDRTWVAPPSSGLMMSMLVEPLPDIDLLHLQTTAVGLAATAACRDLGASVSLKWPNDVVTDDGRAIGSKLAGVLAETVVVDGSIAAIVVGLGLNLRSVPGREAAIKRSVAVLDDLIDERLEPSAMAKLVLKELQPRLRLLGEGCFDPIRAEARAVSSLLGRRVIVDLDGESLEGTATDIDQTGRLVVETATGRRVLSVGDVVRTVVE